MTIDDLRRLCGSLISVEEPILKNAATDLDLDSFLVRTAYEQFPFQQSAFEELARTTALLDWAADVSDQHVITPEFWHRVLGCTLSEFVGLALLLQVGALSNGGVFDPGWVDQENFAPILERLDRSVIQGVARRHFVATLDEFRTRADANRQSDRYLRRFEFNPLTAQPFVELPGSLPISPIPRFALARATPNGLYYLGVAHSGTTYTDALGAVFETYVGQQLQLARPVELLPDTEYRRGYKAADYVAVFDNAVLIVEAKATPMTAESRIGGSRLNSDLDRTLGKGVQQIHNTSALIESRHVAFRSVPRDLPRIGIVVTMEPYFQANSNEHLIRVEPTDLGEPLIAEFANTLYIDGSKSVDVLEYPRSVEAWLQQAPCTAGLDAPRRIRKAEVEQLRLVRDAIRQLLLSTLGQTCRDDVAIINDAAIAAQSRRALAWRQNGSLHVVAESEASRFETLLSSIATAVIDAVQHGNFARYLVCSRPDCHMFYFQHHHRRRYCNQRCANADRQARYNRRLHPNTL